MAASGVFENQGAAVVQWDFRCLPCRALIDAVWVGIGRIPWTVEPIKVGFVVGDPFLDGLPGWLDGLHGIDVEGWRRRAGEMDDAFPEAVEPEKEFDFLTTEDLADGLHGALAAGALERVATPDF